MAGLLRDRYFEYAPNRGWDLLTGEPMSSAGGDDEPRRTVRPADALIELLGHGVDGSPRWIVTKTTRAAWRAACLAGAAEARSRGYVPIAVDIFLRSRLLLENDLRTRAMLLIARTSESDQRLRVALLHAAAISPRPHLLWTPALEAPAFTMRRGFERTHTAPSRRLGSMHWRAAEAKNGRSLRL